MDKINRSKDRIVKVSVKDMEDNNLETYKANIKDKSLGAWIISRLKELFGLSNPEIQEYEKSELEEELMRQKELFKKA
jgi:hypothetical protein